MYSWFDTFGPADTPADARALRTAFSNFATGVCLVTTVAADGKREGMTINSFASVSLQPALLLWSIRDEARSADVFVASGRFVVSVLGVEQQELALHFARPAEDKFAKFADQFEDGLGGCPRLRASIATFECATWSRHKEGDHTILIGKVERFSSSHGAPLATYAGKLGAPGEIA
ncbi:flavin reductase family protein [Pseudoduganella namucuonensis]|uniref:NADH-FMN oxidoreductase RutF, flavin reductase (DIM6/NTAB) family n=1 Tax=Pseudoduganella namucuonensis TaxID=1035707 RepID=A0A1I7LHM0_9BURK|nr:flavin reductase family protein [Pseudoduganella namucuonensis]SFV09187.1 NADH-FMN oxidoreductase RutF, flavin reductase (DIM6/NTAB) family [Pseudoduganella namucuonensis]